MNTYLGASEHLGPDDVDPDSWPRAQVPYLEGYLFDRPEARRPTGYAGAARPRRRAAGGAHPVRQLLRRAPPRPSGSTCITDGVDILFANEDEICALYEVDDVRRGRRPRCAGHCEIAALTCGARGSVVVTADDDVQVDAHPCDHRVDTTGAGDLYAAGFLYGSPRRRPGDVRAARARWPPPRSSATSGPARATSLAELAQRVLALRWARRPRACPTCSRAGPRAWMADDPDPATRARARGAARRRRRRTALADRFAERLEFGTAGLRGALGAGPDPHEPGRGRAGAAAGWPRYLLGEVPGAARRGVVVGRDARHGSDDFAARRGGRAHGCRHPAATSGPVPCRRRSRPGRCAGLGAAAGVMVTASHNPPAGQRQQGLRRRRCPDHPARRRARSPRASTPSAAGRTSLPLGDAATARLARRLGDA